MKKEKKYRVIGLMSGTSLDGVDLAHVVFQKKQQWTFQLGAYTTIPYPEKWLNRLTKLPLQSSTSIQETSEEYGRYLGELTKSFIKEHQLKVDFIASHGHTIFHQPEKGYTLQIGDGQILANSCQQTVICDFRSLDVSLGGQGAPLVPIGDQLLFSDYDYCLNLGGFSNISYQENSKRKAYDICPVNIVLNDLAQQTGHPYDKGGEMARNGSLIPSLYKQLNALNYYDQKAPKSLGKEWVEKFINPLLNQHTNIPDLLHTFTEHAAYQIGKVLTKGNCLLSGGGAFNTFLLERLEQHSTATLQLPPKEIINYKEAIVFAFLGVLRYRNEANCLQSVTGAKRDCSGGVVFTP